MCEVDYVAQRPNFDNLADLRDDVKNILKHITALAEGSDIAGRAADLLNAIADLHQDALNILTVPRHDDDE